MAFDIIDTLQAALREHGLAAAREGETVTVFEWPICVPMFYGADDSAGRNR